jgi:hypothetical protein
MHLTNDMHDFPAGENARDFVLREASKPGGLVEAGGVQIGRRMTYCSRILLLQSVDAKEKKMHGALVSSTGIKISFHIASHQSSWKCLTSCIALSQSCEQAK